MSASSVFRSVSNSGLDICGLDSVPRIQSTTGVWNRIVFSHVASTNTVGKRLAAAYLNQGSGVVPTIVMTAEQTHGRGRLGRNWTSPPGGIYASLVVPREPCIPLSTLPLAVPIALCRELDKVVDAPVRLKWPNDLMVNGRKLGGVLIETVGRDSTVAVVVGFGINYARQQAAVEGAVSVLEIAEQTPSLRDLASQLIEATAGEVMAGRTMDLVVDEYSTWSVHEAGQRMTCRTAAATVSGTFIGFDDNGFLRLQTDRGEQTISAGDVIETGEQDPHV